MTTFSILIAVYNAEQYLKACLDSLLYQSYSNFEVIAVDDASTDHSLDILRYYATRDPRFKVIASSTNQGQAKARNKALSVSQGKYICFLDSDDWLSTDALRLMEEAFRKHPTTDSVMFHLINVYPDGHQTSYPMNGQYVATGEQAFKDSLTWKIHGVYGVKRDIHLRYPYDTTTHAYSDDNTTRLHFINSREVRCCEGKYFYRQHNQSVTHQVSIRRFDYLLANQSMKKQLLAMQCDPSIIALYENQRWLNLVGLYYFYYRHRKNLTLADRKQGLEIMHATWRSIQGKLIHCKYFFRLGYIPILFSWSLFRLQEELYFNIRQFLGKNQS